MHDELLTIVQGYAFDCYYPHGQISQKREKAAIHNYGVDPRDTILAIIDSTVMGFTQGGSAENGMALTLKGVYWKNMWPIATRRNHYTWGEMTQLYKRLEVTASHVQFEPGVQFCTPAQFKAPQIINLLQIVTRHYIELTEGADQPRAEVEMPKPSAAVAAIASRGGEGGGAYQTGLVNAFALIICHAGTHDDQGLDMAVDFIQNDDLLPNASESLGRLSDLIESIRTDAAKSAAYLKLRQGRVIAECPGLPAFESERVLIMIEAIVEAIGGGENPSCGRQLEALRKVYGPR